jgi:hypothetical protein
MANRDKARLAMRARRIMKLLIENVFPDIHPEFGDLDKVKEITDFIVLDRGIRDPDFAVMMVKKMAIEGGGHNRQPVDIVFDSVRNQRAIQ